MPLFLASLPNFFVQLYDAREIVDQLSALHLEIIPEEQDKLGGVMYFTDTKPVTHCVLFARKTA